MSERLNQFFAREAAEYLTELAALLHATGRPDPDELLRLSTGVRGSAEMAEADRVAVLAEALEDAARSLAGGRSDWSDDLRDLAVDTVHDLRELVAALGRWGQGEDERLRIAVGRWDRARSEGTSGAAGTAGEVADENLTRREDLPVNRGWGSATGSAAEDVESGTVERVIPISELFYDDAGPHILGEADVSASGEAAPAVSAADGDTAASETGSGVRSFYAAAPVHGADGVMEGVEVPEANAVSGGAPDRTFGAPEPSDAEPGGAAVPIAELIFRGSSALHEALSLRPRIEAAARDGSSASLDALITELFDLVELGIEADHPNEG